MDSDLAESLQALKASFERRVLPAQFGKAEQARVDALRSTLRVPRRFREFLLAADPLDVETRTPAERVRLVPSERLLEEQRGFALAEDGSTRSGPAPSGWRPGWVVIAHSALLGDPYFLDVASPDAEGDCPVFTAMSGTETWKPRLCASSFATFLRILAIGMEVAKNFPDRDVDMDDEQVFREALGPRIREYDPAAAKAGHWT
ncbi:MAG TPA: SMI1/KNR4 family protein [Polyangiaceae bacterium]|nr:SMI1/KNR4 family protein [Polyangiaceae bacterium]